MLEGASFASALPRPARVVANYAQNYRTRTLVLDLDLPHAQPGQFVMVWLPGLDEKPFSLAGANPLSLTIAKVGPFSSALLAGGGYGVAPLAFLAERLLAAGRQVAVAVGARCAADLLLLDVFAALGVDAHVATDDGSAGMPGPVTGLVQEILDRQVIDAVYACGPNAMLDAVARLASAARIPAQVSREAYMRCGAGVCGSCEHDGRLVCRDGPVFLCQPSAEAAAEAPAPAPMQ